eukprot:3830160-Rhodomonas_salina.1
MARRMYSGRNVDRPRKLDGAGSIFANFFDFCFGDDQFPLTADPPRESLPPESQRGWEGTKKTNRDRN